MTLESARLEAQHKADEMGHAHYIVNASMFHDSETTWIVTTEASKRYYTLEAVKPRRAL
jgi:hypothetical protein